MQSMARCRRLRRWLELSLVDVETATGIPSTRLAKAERDRLELNTAEEAALESFYRARWRMAHADDAHDLTLLMREN